MILEVSNDRTEILYAHPEFLQVLKKALAYPSDELVRAQKSGTTFQSDSGWDGYIHLLRTPQIKSPWFPSGLLPLTQRMADKFEFPLNVIDRRERPEDELPEPVNIPLFDYQKDAVDAAEEAGRGVWDMPPRAGKTRSMCELQRRLNQWTLWIAPTDNIVQQTLRTLEEWFGPHYAMHQKGSKGLDKAAHYRVVVATAASAVRFSQEFMDTRTMMVVDEFHRAAAKTYHKISNMLPHVFFRYGMTGTFKRSGYDRMAMEAVLSQCIYKIETKELMRLGRLTPTKVYFVKTPGRFSPAGYDTFQNMIARPGLQEYEPRNHMIGDLAKFLLERGRKILILVATKAQGWMIKERISELVPRNPPATEFDVVEFVSTDRSRHLNEKILEAYNESDEVKILIGTSMIGEGTDLPPADALIYASGGKAEVTLDQATFRVCTACEGKKDAIIIDFNDRQHKKLAAHSLERARVFHQQDIFEVKIMQTEEELTHAIATETQERK